jgi:3-hydroxyisobutyrate dehydrogenase-like beta-hydroxyacid dehydrogenase
MDVAFIGLGGMGTAMAEKVLEGGHRLTVWNRSASKAEALVKAGASPARTPADAASKAEVVATMVADEAALEEVTLGSEGLIEGLAKGAIHVSMSTVGPEIAERLAKAHAERGQGFVSAPVFGRPDAVRAHRLFVAAAGADADLDRCQPLFDALGQKTFRVGPEPREANLVKLCGNFLILSAVEAMAEALAMAQKGGVERGKLIEVLTGTLFGSPAYQVYGAILAEERYRPAGFTAPLGLKDMRLLAKTAEAARVPMPLLSLLRDHLIATIAQEGEDIDWSGIGRTVSRSAGL